MCSLVESNPLNMVITGAGFCSVAGAELN